MTMKVNVSASVIMDVSALLLVISIAKLASALLF